MSRFSRLFFAFAFICATVDCGRYKINEEGCGQKAAKYLKTTSDQTENEVNQDRNQNAKIVGGHPAKPYSWPWHVGIFYKHYYGEDFFCGGTIINPKFVLTAAHCNIAKPNQIVIRVGAHELTKRNDGYKVNIDNFINHPEYNLTNSDHDLALIKLTQELKWDTKTRPVCLAESAMDRDYSSNDTRATVIGWGQTKEARRANKVLHQVEVEFVTLEQCKQMYAVMNETVTENMICAASDGKDACQGDSGGSLTVGRNDQRGTFRYYQHGITSFGIGCARKEFPGVYTRINKKHLDWIAKEIGKVW